MYFSGPVVGVEINGTDCVQKSRDVMSAMSIGSNELHISASKEAAQAEIEAFYNFLDIGMN